jgi:chaperonin cofactor prefoldin
VTDEQINVERFDILEGRLDSHLKAHARLEARLETVERASRGAEEKLEALKGRTDSLSLGGQACASAGMTLNAGLAALTGIVRALEQRLDNPPTVTIRGLAQVEDLDDRLRKLELLAADKLGEAGQRIAVIEAKLVDLNVALDEQDGARAHDAVQVEALDHQVALMRGDFLALRGQRPLEETLAKLSDKVSGLETIVKVLDEMSAKRFGELAALRARLEPEGGAR